MQPSYRIVPAEAAHVLELAARLRSADVAEIQAAGIDATRALWHSYRRSLFSRTAVVDGDVAAIWGMGGSALGMVGEPWLLTSPAIERAKVAFIREARRQVAGMLLLRPVLRGHVDARYKGAIRFLEVMGFDVGPEAPFGVGAAMFRQYSLQRTNVEGMRWAS